MIIQIITVREIADADYWEWAAGLNKKGVPIDPVRLFNTGVDEIRSAIPGVTRVGSEYKVFRHMTLEQFVEKGLEQIAKRGAAKEGAGEG